MNKLFWFTDCAYATPMETYYFGAVGARDIEHVYELLGTKKIDTLCLGDTTYEGQITIGEALRAIEPRTFNDARKAMVDTYQVNEGVDLSARKAYIASLLEKQYGWTPESIDVRMERMERIPAEIASSGADMWRAWAKVETIEDLLPLFLTFEGTDEKDFRNTGEQVEYTYHVIVNKPLSPTWHMVDLLEDANKVELFPEAAFVCRKATMSSEPVEGWEQVDEVYGNHTVTLWLNPDWKAIQEKAVAAILAEVELQSEANAVSSVGGVDATASLDDMFGGDIPGLDPDAGVEGGVDAAAEDDNCAGGACKI